MLNKRVLAICLAFGLLILGVWFVFIRGDLEETPIDISQKLPQNIPFGIMDTELKPISKDAVVDLLQRYQSQVDQQCVLPSSALYNLKFYTGVSHSFYRVKVEGKSRSLDENIRPTNGQFYNEFYFDNEENIVYVVANDPNGEPYVTGHSLYRNDRLFARITYSKNGLSFGDYVYYYKNKPYLSCRILKDGSAVLIEMLLEE